jgi:putative spermidine/putrescine transport system ATP-binding protein
MGGQNVLTGRLEGVEGGTARLAGTEGVRLQFPLRGRQLPPGSEQAYIAVRRDHIELRRAVAGGPTLPPNTVPGTVAMTEYQGPFVKVTVERREGEEIVVHVPDDRFMADRLRPGDPVLASFAPEYVHVLRQDLYQGEAAARPYAGEVA